MVRIGGVKTISDSEFPIVFSITMLCVFVVFLFY